MNEAETRAELIDPALHTAGWGIIENSRIRREVIAPGRLVGNGKRAQSDIADYVHHTVRDAVEQLGSVANISEVFIGFQQYLYSQGIAA